MDVFAPLCPTQELKQLCYEAKELTVDFPDVSPACQQLYHLANMDVATTSHGAKGSTKDSCASMKTWLNCNPHQVLENTVEPTIPTLLYACDTSQLSQTEGAVSTGAASSCRFVSPMPEAQFARAQQQRAYALINKLKILKVECRAGVSSTTYTRDA
uniref:Uncharacterized protein n=1 Tax=viral metagenome TaxID=1070528 RepID=A0A6C0C198_9ZZZZ